MDKRFLSIVILTVVLQRCFAPPVTQNKKDNVAEQEDDSEIGGLEDYMEYHRYLKEIVSALESDPDFRQKLEKANESEIKSGRIAEELQFVSHHVRSRLDEIKRVELQRLKELMEKKIQLERGDSNSIDQDPTHHHLDQSNPHTFEIEDLKKLIAKTTQDLAEADRKRKEEFKRYEMEKEYLKQEKLNHTNGEDKEKLEKEYQQMEDKHKKHEKLHQPGHKAQLEEVWQEQDQMQQDFDPKTFFMLHDIDGNGLWDQEEVKALFIKELNKMYQDGVPEDDMRERAEEMERMRESVFIEMDKNNDGFIDYKEFMQQTNSNDFSQDHGWQGLDEQTRPYTDEELAEYVRRHHQANQIPQQAYQVPHPGGYVQVPPGAYQQVPQYQQVPGGYQHPNQIPPQQFHPGQVPQMPPQDLGHNIPYQQVQGHPQQQHPQYQQPPPQYQQRPPQPNQQQPPQPNQQQPPQPNQQQPAPPVPQYQQPPQVNQPPQPAHPQQASNVAQAPPSGGQVNAHQVPKENIPPQVNKV